MCEIVTITKTNTILYILANGSWSSLVSRAMQTHLYNSFYKLRGGMAACVLCVHSRKWLFLWSLHLFFFSLSTICKKCLLYNFHICFFFMQQSLSSGCVCVLFYFFSNLLFFTRFFCLYWSCMLLVFLPHVKVYTVRWIVLFVVYKTFHRHFL